MNGGLFSGSTAVPQFSKIARSYLLHIGGLDWTQINPDIFGSMIQAVADDGQTRLHLRVETDTIWLSQLEIAELFQTTKQNVSLHASNIFEDNELLQESVVKDSLTTAADLKEIEQLERDLKYKDKRL